jgi:hypothetical protein
MAGMQRFVTYIYSYEDNQKGSNVGFARVEVRGGTCRLEIHLRGIFPENPSCIVYLLRLEQADTLGFPVGEMTLANGMGNCVLTFSTEHIANSEYALQDMDGLLLRNEENRFFLSRWKETSPFLMSAGHFHIWEADADTPGKDAASSVQARAELGENAASSVQARAELGDNAASSVQARAGLSGNAASAVPAEKAASGHAASSVPDRSAASCVSDGKVPEKNIPAEAASPDISATEIPMRNVFPCYSWEEIWESLRRERPVFAPFENPSILCVRIELKDLRELPRRFWYLGNNSFLLHGFFNYRYLVIGRLSEDKWFLGVPGVYQNQERVMAAIFGFPEFISEVLSGELPDTGETVNRFGYWYRLMDET